jgi:hypothetical protein
VAVSIQAVSAALILACGAIPDAGPVKKRHNTVTSKSSSAGSIILLTISKNLE